MKVTMTFIEPEKLKRLNEIRLAEYKFNHKKKTSPENKTPVVDN